jgi:hypothetical protein
MDEIKTPAPKLKQPDMKDRVRMKEAKNQYSRFPIW